MPQATKRKVSVPQIGSPISKPGNSNKMKRPLYNGECINRQA